MMFRCGSSFGSERRRSERSSAKRRFYTSFHAKTLRSHVLFRPCSRNVLWVKRGRHLKNSTNRRTKTTSPSAQRDLMGTMPVTSASIMESVWLQGARSMTPALMPPRWHHEEVCRSPERSPEKKRRQSNSSPCELLPFLAIACLSQVSRFSLQVLHPRTTGGTMMWPPRATRCPQKPEQHWVQGGVGPR